MPDSSGADQRESDKRLTLAYEAGQALLKVQDSTLGNIRTRANNLLATSALFVSFSSGIGLITTDPSKGKTLPEASAWVLLVLTISVGICVLYVLWPAKGWDFGADTKTIMKQREAGRSDDEIREYVIDAMISGIDGNDLALKRKQKAFRLAALSLSVEVIALVTTIVLKQ